MRFITADQMTILGGLRAPPRFINQETGLVLCCSCRIYEVRPEGMSLDNATFISQVVHYGALDISFLEGTIGSDVTFCSNHESGSNL